jgi:hypothetical protein
MGLGILLLAIAVFGWGIKYKLSLYDAPGSFSTHIAQAKLLSQKERSVAPTAVDSARAASPLRYSSILYAAIWAATLIFTLHLAVALRCSTVTAGGSLRKRLAHSSFFSFRPPPVTA